MQWQDFYSEPLFSLSFFFIFLQSHLMVYMFMTAIYSSKFSMSMIWRKELWLRLLAIGNKAWLHCSLFSKYFPNYSKLFPTISQKITEYFQLFPKIFPIMSIGRLMEPPSRVSAWRLGFSTPVHYTGINHTIILYCYIILCIILCMILSYFNKWYSTSTQTTSSTAVDSLVRWGRGCLANSPNFSSLGNTWNSFFFHYF